MKLVKKSIWILLIILVVGTSLFFLGPTVEIDTAIRPVELPDDLDNYLAASEARVTNLRPNTEKVILWADPAAKSKTEVAVVYLHGFSATRQETAPLADNIAKALEANLFYTRLTGHGQDGQALSQATVNDWLNDTAEALAIGRRLGERIVIVGASTGGTLATWLVNQPDSDDVVALVLISPNYGLRDSRSEIMLWPWARVIVPLVGGKTRHRDPVNEDDARYWTTSYPTVAVMPVMGLVDITRKLEIETIDTPVLMLYSPTDQQSNPEASQAIFERWGSEIKQRLPINDSSDPFNHVIAGDIRSPNTTVRVTGLALDLLETARLSE